MKIFSKNTWGVDVNNAWSLTCKASCLKIIELRPLISGFDFALLEVRNLCVASRLPRRFFPTEQMLTEQLNTGAQEPRVLNIYRNYLFTTQENQLLAFDSFRVITSFEKLPNFRCRRWHFHSPISRNSIQTHF